MDESKTQVARVREAFDRHSVDYDRQFGDTRLGRELRARTWTVLDGCFSPGSRVIDLGCGTGDDAIHLACRGVHVSGIDLSAEMTNRVVEKAKTVGVSDLVQCRVGDYSTVSFPPRSFDGLYSNFGALNCVAHIDWLGAFAARVLRPGSRLVIVLLGSLYPLETVVHLVKGRPSVAFRRFRRAGTAIVGGTEFDVHYHRFRHLRRSLGDRFVLEQREALNLLVPVPGFDHLDRRFRGVFDAIKPLDRFLCRLAPFSAAGDHSLSVWRFRG